MDNDPVSFYLCRFVHEVVKCMHIYIKKFSKAQFPKCRLLLLDYIKRSEICFILREPVNIREMILVK